MNCLVPLDTATATSAASWPNPSSYTLTQQLAQGVMSATFDLTPYGFASPPSSIVPTIIRPSSSSSNIVATPRAWSATSFTCDLTSPTDSSTYVCSIQIVP